MDGAEDSKSSTLRRVLHAALTLGALFLALVHFIFGLTNFQPGFPKLEGVASITAGMALLVSLLLAGRSMFWALVTACLGTLPLAVWFGYAVPVEGSSDPLFFFVSLVLPVGTGLAALSLGCRRRTGANA